MFEALIVHKQEATHAMPPFATELASHAWRLAYSGGKTANATDVTMKEPITFNSRNTIDMADYVNSTGNFAS